MAGADKQEETQALSFTPPDYDVLDNPVLARFMFYPRADRRPAPPGSRDVIVEADDGVALGGRLYMADAAGPSILYFHGNGEVVSDYDDIAPLYAELGVNLLVTDYRGYGTSAGRPTTTSRSGSSAPAWCATTS